MANLFNLLKPSAKLPRNGFDLSQRHLFTASAGELLPICPIDCVPGDHHEINVLEMARTNAVHTDAFVRMKQYFEFYFVPYTQIWNSFNEFIATREDGWSTELSPNMTAVPYISFHDLLLLAYDLSVSNEGRDVWDLQGFLKIFDYLGYGAFYCLEWSGDRQSFENSVDDYLGSNKNVRINLFRLLSYQKIFCDYYRNSVYDTRLFFEQDDAGVGYPYKQSYNLDFVKDGVSPDLSVHIDQRAFAFYTNMHYRQWKKDMFTGLYPDTQFGAVSKAPLSDFVLQSYDAISASQDSYNSVTTRINTGDAGVLKTFGYNTGQSPNLPARSITFNSPAAIDVLQLLKAEALQKWRQSTMLAGNRTEDQWEAHYGTKPRFHRDTRCQFVGAFDSYIGLNEVVATNSSNEPTNNPLGDIGAHGVGTADGKITFDCQDFGTLICIYSVSPSAEYNSFMCDKNNNNIEHFDFWTPEFQNLGMEVVPSSIYDVSLKRHTGGGSDTSASFSLGYAPRYYSYKTAVDKAHGQFMKDRAAQSYTQGESDFGSSPGVFSHWCSPRVILSNEPIYMRDGLPLDSLYIHPDSLDSVFVQESNQSNFTDQFLVNCYFDIKSVRNMSVLGLPQF